jgi:hypothetical protein
VCYLVRLVKSTTLPLLSPLPYGDPSDREGRLWGGATVLREDRQTTSDGEK